MKVGVDATPLLGAHTGVGRYVAGLLRGLSELARPPELVITAFTWRGAGALGAYARPPIGLHHRRAPARLLRAGWRYLDLPPLEWLAGEMDVFHATNFVLPPARRAAGVLTVHDLAFMDHPDTLAPASLAYRSLVPRGLARAGAVCCPSRAVARSLISRFDVDPDRVVITPNGLSPVWLADPRPMSPSSLAARGLPASYVLFVGTDEPRKNLPVLLAALRELPEAPPLVIAGPSGWGEQSHGRGVFRTGYLPEAQLAGLVAGAQLLVLPSREEGFGIPALEAFACGTPVVASDLPVFREVLGDLACYAPVGEVPALAEAIAKALALGPAAGAEQRRAHAASYTWRRCAEAAMRSYTIAATRPRSQR